MLGRANGATDGVTEVEEVEGDGGSDETEAARDDSEDLVGKGGGVEHALVDVEGVKRGEVRRSGVGGGKEDSAEVASDDEIRQALGRLGNEVSSSI